MKKKNIIKHMQSRINELVEEGLLLISDNNQYKVRQRASDKNIAEFEKEEIVLNNTIIHLESCAVADQNEINKLEKCNIDLACDTFNDSETIKDLKIEISKASFALIDRDAEIAELKAQLIHNAKEFDDEYADMHEVIKNLNSDVFNANQEIKSRDRQLESNKEVVMDFMDEVISLQRQLLEMKS